MYGQIYNNERISYQTIIFSCDQLDLWSWFLGFRIGLHEQFCNPLRSDKHPNCFLSWAYHKSERIVLNDYADRQYHGMSVFDAIMYKYNLDFSESLQKINNEFIKVHNIELKENSSYQSTRASKFIFILQHHPWTLNKQPIFIKHDKVYWEQYGISSKELKEDNVQSNRRITFNSKNNPDQFTSLDVTPSYTYLFKNHKKCYQPYNDIKWLSTCSDEDIWGWDNMTNDDLIITKSYKDYRVLKNSGYNTIALQSEGTKIPFDKLLKLKEIKTKYVLFDNDAAGIKASQMIADFGNSFDSGYIPVTFSEDLPKDASDIVKQYSNSFLENELLNLGVK